MDESKKHSYHGVVVLLSLMLIFSNIRLVIENYTKYGFIPPSFILGNLVSGETVTYTINVLLLIKFSILLVFFTEKNLSVTKSRKPYYWIHVINLGALFLAPIAMTLVYDVSPFANCGVLMVVLITFLKLWSYVVYWNDVRYFLYKNKTFSKSSSINKELQGELYKEIDEVLSNYPKNLTLSNLLLFLSFPVLCYQYKFPRTPRVRRRYLLKYIAGFFGSLFFQL